jgi:hypothetical protein
MRKPPDTVDQRRKLRDDLHRYINTCLDHWDTILRQADDMAAGYPPTTTGGGGNGENTLVEAQALATIGPGEQANDWLAHWSETVAHLTNTYSDLMRLLPMTDDEKAKAQQRENTVEVCTDCGDPAPKVRRINGKPYHADSCYYRRWRAMRKDEAG